MLIHLYMHHVLRIYPANVRAIVSDLENVQKSPMGCRQEAQEIEKINTLHLLLESRFVSYQGIEIISP